MNQPGTALVVVFYAKLYPWLFFYTIYFMGKETFIHQTDAPAFSVFNTPEVWAAPDDTAFYGSRSIRISGEMENPFIMSDLDAPEQAEKNIALYEALGGEANPDVFNILREQGYDGIIERNGDRCFLYPEKVEILNQDIHAAT